MRVLFMGTPEFAVKTLEKCIEHHEVIAVFTQPDKPKGRGNKMTPSEVKVVAQNHEIPVYQPIRIRKEDWPIQIRALQPDVIVVVAYGQILSQEILDIPKYGCINVHASLLPKYRGAAPINWAIVKGEEVSGVTTMQMDVGLDTGDMLLKTEVAIDDMMTAQELHDILSLKGADLLIDTLNNLQNGSLIKEKQDNEISTYAMMLNKDLAKIDWNKTAKEIHNQVRGFNPWPVAHTSIMGDVLKIYKTKPWSRESFLQEVVSIPLEQAHVGEIIHVNKTGIFVNTGEGILRLDEIQVGSNKRMATQAFLLGHSIDIGTVLE